MALWTPLDEAGLIGWWDMSNPSSYNSTTDIWSSKYGNLDLISDGGDGPTKIATGFDGTYDALSFTGAADTGLKLVDPNFREHVGCAVFRATSSVDFASFARAFEVNRLEFFSFGGGRVRYLNQTNDYYEGGAWPQTVLIVWRMAAANRVLRWNGTEVIDDSTAATGTLGELNAIYRIFHYRETPQAWSAHLGAFGLFTAASWSDALAEQIEGYCAHEGLGITTAILPSGHTYKSAAPTVVGGTLEVAVSQTISDFSQTAVVANLPAIDVAQTIADFSQSLVLGAPTDVLSADVTQTISDFTQVFTTSTTTDFSFTVLFESASAAGEEDIAVDQTMDDFVQTIVLASPYPAPTRPTYNLISCGPGSMGTPVNGAMKNKHQGLKRWPTK